MDDAGGGYKAGVAQDSYSMFIDIYIYLDDILREFGGIYVLPEREDVFGIDCVHIDSADFCGRTIAVTNEMNCARSVLLKIEDEAAKPVAFEPYETKSICW
jgi:hypothetical protein